jgi:CheY-like chemotaxis protein
MVHVLVVDDESVTRRLVGHTLKSLNVEVVGAEDGGEAITLAGENTPALVLVDINLPDIDGFGLIQQLKALPNMANVPMIMFTARNHSGDALRAKEVGAAGFLYKPFSTQELRDLVTRYLNP